MKDFQRMLLFILLFGTMLLFGMIENIKGISYPLIREEFSASWEQIGLMVSILSIAYTSFTILAGIFLGRFGIKPSFLLGYGAIFAGLIAVFFVPGFFLAVAALLLAFSGFGIFEISINALASRLFVKKAALLMNLLHSFYGIGAVIGPVAAGFIAGRAGLGWRYAYFLALPLVLALFIPAIITRFPRPEGAGNSGSLSRKGFFDALRSPLVWLMSFTLGIAVVTEMNSANWGPMYFQDVYGLDPNTDGATFLSTFFLVFTVSRLVCGLIIERIGYLRALLGAAFIVLAIYAAGFILGERGIFVLPALGFFVALFWPTLMAVSFVRFGKDAPVFSSAIIAIGGLVYAGMQFIVGLTNQLFGSAWGYRSSLIHAAALVVLLLLLYRKLGKPGDT